MWRSTGRATRARSPLHPGPPGAGAGCGDQPGGPRLEDRHFAPGRQKWRTSGYACQRPAPSKWRSTGRAAQARSPHPLRRAGPSSPDVAINGAGRAGKIATSAQASRPSSPDVAINRASHAGKIATAAGAHGQDHHIRGGTRARSPHPRGHTGTIATSAGGRRPDRHTRRGQPTETSRPNQPTRAATSGTSPTRPGRAARATRLSRSPCYEQRKSGGRLPGAATPSAGREQPARSPPQHHDVDGRPPTDGQLRASARRRSDGGGPGGSTSGASASMARSEARTASLDLAR